MESVAGRGSGLDNRTLVGLKRGVQGEGTGVALRWVVGQGEGIGVALRSVGDQVEEVGVQPKVLAEGAVEGVMGVRGVGLLSVSVVALNNLEAAEAVSCSFCLFFKFRAKIQTNSVIHSFVKFCLQEFVLILKKTERIVGRIKTIPIDSEL